MKKSFCNKKYAGILWAIILAIAFVVLSVLGGKILNGVSWFVYSSILRIVFGVIILFIVNKVFDRPVKDVLSIKGSKMALLGGGGFIVFFLYYLVALSSGIKAISGLTIGLFLSRVILQQIATGFYEELHYRLLVLEGYFYGAQNTGSKLLYGLINFMIFGGLHALSGGGMYRFWQTGAIGFAFAVMYLKSRNILVPMLLHFVYDIFANLASFIVWNNSALFNILNSALDIALIVMFVLSLVVLLMKEKKADIRPDMDFAD